VALFNQNGGWSVPAISTFTFHLGWTQHVTFWGSADPNATGPFGGGSSITETNGGNVTRTQWDHQWGNPGSVQMMDNNYTWYALNIPNAKGGRWYEVTYGHDGQYFWSLVDGVFQRVYTNGYTSGGGSPTQILLGNSNDGWAPFGGKVARWAMWTQSLSRQEAEKLQGGAPAAMFRRGALVADWGRMDSPARIVDQSGNGNHLTSAAAAAVVNDPIWLRRPGRRLFSDVALAGPAFHPVGLFDPQFIPLGHFDSVLSPLAWFDRDMIVGPTISVGDVTVALTGIASTWVAGALATARSLALSGGAAATGQGTLTPTRSLAMTGINTTPASGTLTTDRSLSLSGAGSTSSQGSVGVSRSIALTGPNIVSWLGVLGYSINLSVSGIQTPTALGTLVPGRSIGLSGSPITVDQGYITLGLSVQGVAVINLLPFLFAGIGTSMVSSTGGFAVEPSSTMEGQAAVPVIFTGATDVRRLSAGGASAVEIGVTSVTPIGQIGTDSAANVRVGVTGGVSVGPSALVSSILAKIEATTGVALDHAAFSGIGEVPVDTAGSTSLSRLSVSSVTAAIFAVIEAVAALGDDLDAIAAIGTLLIDASGNLIDEDTAPLGVASAAMTIVVDLGDGNDTTSGLVDVQVSVSMTFQDENDYQTIAQASIFDVVNDEKRRVIAPGDKRSVLLGSIGRRVILDPINRRVTVAYSSKSVTVI
jgi:hypothetical protein